jgi:hypothetical protein
MGFDAPVFTEDVLTYRIVVEVRRQFQNQLPIGWLKNTK